MEVIDAVVFCASLICCSLLIFTFDNFYGCDESVSESLVMFSVDIYRIVSTVVLLATFYMYHSTNYKLTRLKYIFSFFALGALMTFMLHIVKVSEVRSDDYCMMKRMAPQDWNLELQKIFKNDAICTIDTGSKNVVETMENPHVMTSASAWCTERIQKRCVGRRLKYNSVMDCLRHGATDFVQHLQYIYVFDLLGDLCRFFLFVKFAVDRDLEATTTSILNKASESYQRSELLRL